MNKVIRNGKVAVLYSPEEGWYSWNRDFPEILYHPEIVKMVENKEHYLISDWVEQNLDENIYTGGVDSLTIKWLDVNTHFDIYEIDGKEHLITYNDLKLIA